MIDISVIIPAYNVAHYIDKCFNSLLNQTYSGFEVIVIDDGSTDDTLEKIKEYAHQDSRIQVIHKENEGVGVARNLGLSLVNTEYVVFIDPDDYLAPNFLELLHTEAIKTKADVVVCDYYECYENSIEKTLMKLPIEDGKALQVRENKDLIFKINPAPWNKLIKTEVLKKHEVKFPLDYRSEDLVFTSKLLACCETISMIHEPLYFYLANRLNNVSSSYDDRILDTLQALEEIFSFYERIALKDEFTNELEMLAIKQIQYELHKVIYIKNRRLAFRLINAFFQFLNQNCKYWRKNPYYYLLYQPLNLKNKYRMVIYENIYLLKSYYLLRYYSKK